MSNRLNNSSDSILHTSEAANIEFNVSDKHQRDFKEPMLIFVTMCQILTGPRNWTGIALIRLRIGISGEPL